MARQKRGEPSTPRESMVLRSGSSPSSPTSESPTRTPPRTMTSSFEEASDKQQPTGGHVVSQSRDHLKSGQLGTADVTASTVANIGPGIDFYFAFGVIAVTAGVGAPPPILTPRARAGA